MLCRVHPSKMHRPRPIGAAGMPCAAHDVRPRARDGKLTDVHVFGFRLSSALFPVLHRLVKLLQLNLNSKPASAIET